MATNTRPTGDYSVFVTMLSTTTGDIEDEWYASGNTTEEVAEALEQSITDRLWAARCTGALSRRLIEIRNFTHESIDDGMCMVAQEAGTFVRNNDGELYWSLYHPMMHCTFEAPLNGIVQLMCKLVALDGYIMPTAFHFRLGDDPS